MTYRELLNNLLADVRSFSHELRIRAKAEARDMFDNPDIRIAYIKLNSMGGIMEAVEILDAQADYEEYSKEFMALCEAGNNEAASLAVSGFIAYLKAELISRYAKLDLV